MSDELRLCRYVKCRAGLVRKPGERLHHFLKRETCGKSCCNRQRALDREDAKRAAVKKPKKADTVSRAGRIGVVAAHVQVQPAVVDRSLLVNQEMLRERLYRGALR